MTPKPHIPDTERIAVALEVLKTVLIFGFSILIAILLFK